MSINTFDKNFFYNLEIESSEDELDGSIQTVFQNEMCIMTKENADYVKKLREQIEKVDKLKDL